MTLPTIEQVREHFKHPDASAVAVVPLVVFGGVSTQDFYVRDDKVILNINWTDLRQTDEGLQVMVWTLSKMVSPESISLSWRICDGCKATESNCCCAEVETERQAAFGPLCRYCGGDGETGYAACGLGHLYGPGNCPKITGVY